ncbi:MAG: Agmatine deiminase [uncultured Nocardioidaceae bacterium]|uniref:Agmatine deiminase n=1 Tax=uncultured Nocardioidaceae bacterium TaxID=253824 RepID=A0A6J4M036_9ACTN|nr:MAG: Agmatine deiminase [uncultured Nocardioidaceae bacterium]
MPAETEPHERTWMAWPSTGYTLGDTAAQAEEARSAWAAVALAVARFEPVSMVVAPEAFDVARDRLGEQVALHVAPLDDAWMRDMGPTFVVDENGRLGAVDWVFNGWGAQDWATWEHDARVARSVADWAGAEVVGSAMVNEGGGIHVDGLGTVLLTETVQLDPHRNPGWTRADVEAELARTIGARHAVWLPRGLSRDYGTFGTRGHVDIVATFPAPGTVLVHAQRDPAHPDHVMSRETAELLQGSTDADGRPLELMELPAPARLVDEHGPVDHSYVNHLVVNGGVIACTFDDPHDDQALEILAHAYPGREVVGVDARALFERGGGIHCVTAQQPAADRLA